MLEKFYLNNLNSFHPSLVVMFPKPFLIHTDVLQNASNGLMVLFSSSFMTETWCITSAYQNSWTGRLFYVPYRLFVQFVNFFLFFFGTEWHVWLTCDSFLSSLKNCHLAHPLSLCIYTVTFFVLVSFACLFWLHLIFQSFSSIQQNTFVGQWRVNFISICYY